jgi:hypothetical protein
MNAAVDPFVIWSHIRGNGQCRLTELDGFEDTHLFRRASSLAGVWPDDVRFGMDPFNKGNMALADTVSSRYETVVVSKRLAEFLSARLGNQIECLPVSVIDHKKRRVAEPYFFAQPLGLQDALDREHSKPTWSPISPDVIDRVRWLKILADAVPPDVQMFRLKHYMHPVLVRRSLVNAIDAAGFTGVAWQRLSEYRSP